MSGAFPAELWGPVDLWGPPSDDDNIVITTTKVNPIFTSGWKEYLEKSDNGSRRQPYKPAKELLEYRKPGSAEESGEQHSTSGSTSSPDTSASEDKNESDAETVMHHLAEASAHSKNIRCQQQNERRGNKKIRNRPPNYFCSVCYGKELEFCRMNGMAYCTPNDEGPWHYHNVRDSYGRITCPLLYFSTKRSPNVSPPHSPPAKFGRAF